MSKTLTKMNEMQAWAYLEKKFKNANEHGEVEIGEYLEDCLCLATNSLYFEDNITSNTKTAILQKIEAEADRRGADVMHRFFGDGKSGADARAAFCRKQVRLLKAAAAKRAAQASSKAVSKTTAKTKKKGNVK